MIVAIFLFVGTAGVFLPQAAQAGMPVLVDASVPDVTNKIIDTILGFLKAALLNAGVKTASFVLRKVAYDSAVWVASGGKGQGAMAFQKGFGSYLEDVANDAGGTAIGALGEANGLNLCKVPDIKVDLALKVGLRTEFGGSPPPKPACNTRQFFDAWKSGLSKFSEPGALTGAFNVSLKADDSDFGIYAQQTEKIGNLVRSQRESATLSRTEGQGFKSAETKVSGDITTPAQDVKKVAGSQTPDETVKSNEATLNAALASGDVKVFPTILSIFLSTLGSNIINNFQTKGILPFGLCVGGLGGAGCSGTSGAGGAGAGGGFGSTGNPLSYEGAGLSSLGRAAAQSFFSYLTAVKIQEPTQYDLVSQLNSCPDSPGIYNCRLGDDLVNAINQQMTIGAAIKAGILDGNKTFVSPLAETKNNDINCYRTGYCLNNARVLRQVRILPLGFELAAQRSDVSQPWKLSQVVNGFSDCGPNLAVEDPAHPYCHLIDPNWVLKAPLAKCKALVNSASLASADVPNRLQDCVDLQTCVQTNADGSCADYAYCTREKNTWKFPADTCSGQFATCRSFKDINDKTVSYLLSTVDKSFCTSQNIGCQAYSLDKSGKWKNPGVNLSVSPIINSGVFLNNQVEKNCPVSAVGCSAFQVASSTSVQLNLKKAPDYLKCYDSNPTTPAIDWPTSTASLANIKGDAACSNYAGVCTAEERGCNWYTPKSGGGSRIPGKFKPAEISGNQVIWNDQCDAKCVGYNVYREMPANYSNGQDLAYIIPASGNACTIQDQGCTSFTNLSTTTGKSERVEYFTSLRTCLKPDETPDGKGKTYITYEGSAKVGFQLKTYSLLPNDDLVNGPLNAPKYFFKDPVELAQLNAECTELRYKAGTASLDCRQFNDEAGNIYYRLLSKTIPVTDACTPYRISEAAFYNDSTASTEGACLNQYGFWDTSEKPSGVCKKCLSNGKYQNGVCIYEGLASGVTNNAGASQSCSAAADTCRAYKGNAGNNIQNIFTDTFEDPSSINNWVAHASVAMSLSGVSTHVGEHSLAFNFGDATYALGEVGRRVSFDIGKTYDLTFWAYSDSDATVTVKIIPADGSSEIPFGTLNTVSIKKGVWQQYHLGPAEYLANTTTASLDFKSSITLTTYLDNIRLVKVADYLYLVKKSLSVDPVCNSHPGDGLPGEALGCQAYTDPQNHILDLTNFSSLCREGAIGCTGLFDTHNTVSPLADVYNVWFAVSTSVPQLGDRGGTAVATLSHTVPAVNGDTYSCIVPSGRSGCYVDILGHTPEEIRAAIGDSAITNSAIIIPADTPSTTPIYLVANQSASCSQADIGCSYAGVKINNAGVTAYVTTTIKNDPSKYSSTLCQSEAVGCSAFSDGAETNYFKDPEISSQLCEYRTGVQWGLARVDGWFRTNPIGYCYKDKGISCTKASASADCGAGDTCVLYGDNQPCYSDFGLVSSGATDYKNFVGLCPADQNRCTEFVDHADVDSSGKGKSYYLIKNDKVNEGNCSGQVSQKAGCALFDQTDVPTKSWHTTTTYKDSNDNSGALVNPVNDGGNDANTIMKVAQDRECGEWLKPMLSYSVYDDQSNSYKETTQGNLGRCNSVSRCVQNATSSILDVSTYRQRGTSWYDLDYDGFSIPGIYAVDNLEQMNFASTTTSTPDWRLVKRIDPSPCATDGKANCGVGNSGDCVNHKCVQSPDGKSAISANPQSCRAYPEVDSPFPSTQKIVGVSGRGGSSFFRNAHICDENNSGDKGNNQCECDYRKVQYGDIFTKYWKYDEASSTDRNLILNASQKSKNPTLDKPPAGICLGGVSGGSKPLDGEECKVDGDCGLGGVCEVLKSSHAFVGLKGFCLETDSTRHLNSDVAQNVCLTWYPIESLAGVADINAQHTEALSDWQITQKNGGQYCLNSSAPANDPATNKTFDLVFSPGGIKNYSTPTGYDPTIDQGFGVPQYQAILKTGGAGTARKCWYDFWGNHSQINYDQVQKTFNIGNSSVQYSGLTDNTMRDINIDDIEEIDVQVISSGGDKNITSGATFKFPNLTLTNDWQPYYKVLNKDNTTGGVVGGFYKDSTGGSHFIMFYTYLATPSPFANPDGGTGIHLPDNEQISSYWSYGGANYSGLAGEMGNKISAPYPLLYANFNTNLTLPWLQGRSLWVLPNNSITQACPIPPSSGPNFSYASEPVLSHAINIDFAPTFKSIDTYFCGSWNNEANNSSNIYVPLAVATACGGATVAYGNTDEIGYRITYKLRQTCKVAVDARINLVGSANDFSKQYRTVPWTDRLWNINGKGLNAYTVPSPVAGINYDYSTNVSPFGSIDITTPPSSNLLIFTPYTLPGCTKNPAIPAITGCPADDTAAAADGIDRSAKYNLSAITKIDGQTYSFPSSIPAIQSGVVSLSKLYANASNYLWFGTQYGLTPGYGLLPNITGGVEHVPPEIHPLGARIMLNGALSYLEPTEFGFSINNSINAVSTTQDSFLPVSLNFFMFADKNQMPIRQVAIDWDDGSDVSLRSGYFRNQRGAVPSSTPVVACQPIASASDYGHIKDVTCDNAYYEAKNTYFCSGDPKPLRYDNNGTGNCGSVKDFPDGCCIFKPKVQVKDNWGWCNGGSTGVNSGFYDSSWAGSTGRDSCRITSQRPWTPFAGQVVVKYIK